MAQTSEPCQSQQTQAKATYVPWGIDEYQLFGLTRQQLAKKFADKLIFSDNYQYAKFRDGPQFGFDGPTFRMNFANDKVISVQRVFVACNTCNEPSQYGPVLTSKQEAMRFAHVDRGKIKSETEPNSPTKSAKPFQAGRAKPAQDKPRQAH